MSHWTRIAAIVAVFVPSASLAAAEAPASRPAAPATAPAAPAVPEKTLQAIEAQFNRPAGQSREEMLKNYIAQMEEALSLGRQAEKDYADASNLYLVRLFMLEAADFLASQKRDDDSRKLVLSISQRVVDSGAPPEAKIVGDFNLMISKVKPATAKPPTPAEAEKDIRAFVARYANTEASVEAMKRGLVLAHVSQSAKIKEELADTLQSKYITHQGVRRLLKQIGRSPEVGQPFKAELTQLDGKKLALPDDLKGKVVVVDFWATWCGPCVSEVPHMKQVYERYKPKGVEFVGISLDKARAALENFVKDNGIAWVQTFSGKFWDDPTARQYGVEGIPSIWVVGKDGKVVSSDAGGKLEAVLDSALK